MSSFKYLEFEIQIQKVGTGRDYRAQVLNSPAGQGARDFTLPFSDLELENLFLKIGHARGIPSRGPNSPQVEAAKTFGQGLFTAIFEGDVLGCLRTSLDEATRQPDTGLRIRLRLKEVPELADLPWEFLYHTGLNRFLALSVETPVVRFLDLPQRIAPLAVTPPLRVLVMISDPIDQLRLKVEDEWKKLREALSDLERRGVVTLERLENGTLLALQQQLRRNEYHIFHYIGHGVFDPASKDGMLVLEDEQQRGRRVSGRDIGVILHDERTLRLAVLNACEGARAALADPFAGTAQSLVQQGIPSVIAMQFEISDEAAITFAREFYSVVATGSPVDAALSEARRAIFAKGNGLEWGTPVLYLRSADGRIFDFKSQPPPPPSDKVDILLRQARAARDSEDWTVALARGEAILALVPDHHEAQSLIDYVRRQSERGQEPPPPWYDLKLKPREWRLCRKWFLATGGCWALGAFLGAITARDDGAILGLVLGGITAGILQRVYLIEHVGPVQGKKRFFSFLVWVASCVPVMIGMPVGFSESSYVSYTGAKSVVVAASLKTSVLAGFWGGALGGVVTGTLQWLLLRRSVGVAGWWVLVSCCGWALAGVIGGALAKYGGYAWALATAPLIAGAITAIGLVRLLPRNQA